MNHMHIRGWISCLLGACCVAATGCYGADEMQVADTNTNWLRSCDADDDCQGALSCISGRCTIECQRDAMCAALGAGAECAATEDDVSVCDRSCERDQACRAIDPALSCVDGQCREESGQGPLDAGGDAETSPPDSVDAATPMDSFEGENEITLSTAARQARAPAVIWSDDRWLLAWYSSPLGEPESGPPALEVVELTRQGVMATHRIGRPDDPFDHVIGINDADQVAVRSSVGEGCELEIVDWRTGESSAIDAECTADVASIPGTAEWLVAFADDVDVKSGRFSAADGWLTEPQVVGERGAATAVAAAGRIDAATVVWGDVYGSLAYSTSDIEVFPPSSATPFEGAIHSDGEYGLLQLDDRAFAVGSFVGHLWMTVLGGDIEPRVIELADTGVVDVRPGIIWIEQLELAAICFATGDGPEAGAPGSSDGLALAFFDRDGVPAEFGINVVNGLREVHGCDLAWSGSELLVAWVQIDGEDEARTSLVRAKLVNVSP